MDKLIIIAILLVAPAVVYCCRDGVDNVIHLSDCGGEKATIHFANLKVFTYNTKRAPKCFQRKGSLTFPGYIKVSSGQITVNDSFEFNNKSASLYFTLHKNDFFVNKVCKEGVSSHFAMPRRYCKPDLCPIIGRDFCALLNREGIHNLNSINPAWHKFIKTDFKDPFTKLLLKGQWKGEIRIYYEEGEIGCLAFAPNKQEWISVNQ